MLLYGKHEGKTLDMVAATDEGLRYLDWLRGYAHGDLAEALNVYLDDPTIRKDLEELLEE